MLRAAWEQMFATHCRVPQAGPGAEIQAQTTQVLARPRCVGAHKRPGPAVFRSRVSLKWLLSREGALSHSGEAQSCPGGGGGG